MRATGPLGVPACHSGPDTRTPLAPRSGQHKGPKAILSLLCARCEALGKSQVDVTSRLRSKPLNELCGLGFNSKIPKISLHPRIFPQIDE
jgi:hypothetical protein